MVSNSTDSNKLDFSLSDTGINEANKVDSGLTDLSQELPQTDDFKSIVLNHSPLIDVRAPVEFAQGAFENTTNLPLMTDEERHKVGICYKEHGNAAAVKLGHKLVNAGVRAPRVEAWSDFKQANPEAFLYCFRGGMRSKISQQWLKEAGVDIVRLKGGYKAFRRFVIDFLDAVPEEYAHRNIPTKVLAGRTGAGKTIVLNHVKDSIDLEGLAHHRGSAFGRHATPQPTQINFENSLSMALMRFLETNPKQLVLEDEGRNIGSVNMSKPIFDFFKSGERVVLETSLQDRIAITLNEYVIEAQKEYTTVEDWQAFMMAALDRIHKRLGGERYQRVIRDFNLAMQEQMTSASFHLHERWIETLLVEYYDPMYDHQMQKNQHKVAFRGSQQEVIDYLNSVNT